MEPTLVVRLNDVCVKAENVTAVCQSDSTAFGSPQRPLESGGLTLSLERGREKIGRVEWKMSSALSAGRRRGFGLKETGRMAVRERPGGGAYGGVRQGGGERRGRHREEL